jgi:hypothetical protein
MNNELTPLLHALASAQVFYDELDMLQSKGGRLSYFKHDLKRATNQWIRTALGIKMVLSQIWQHIDQEEFDSYVEAKRNLIRRMMNSTFEEIKELDYQLTEVHAKYQMIDVFETMLNTHCIPEAREAYRNKLGYTLEQYLQLKKMQEEGIVEKH